MAKIKIRDLPRDQKISQKEMRRILGGTLLFENYDQKATQYYNMLSSVMKAQKEMQSSVTRNLL